MANNTPLTIIGNLTAPPELRFTQNGIAVASFTIASTPRTFNRQTQEWEDGDALFMRCSAWREMAENIAESFPEKGSRVIAQGNLVQRSFTDRDGNNRTSIELDVQEIGPSLKYATAKPTKVQRGGGGRPQSAPQRDDTGWTDQQGAPAQGGFPDDPPF